MHSLEIIMAGTKINHKKECGNNGHRDEYHVILLGNTLNVGKLKREQIEQRGIRQTGYYIHWPRPYHVTFVRIEKLGINQHTYTPDYLDSHKNPMALVLVLFEKSYRECAYKTENA